MPEPPKTLDEIEVSKFMSCLKDKEYLWPSRRTRIRNYTLAMLMLHAGLRVSETLGLQYHDLFLLGAPVSSLLVRAKIAKNGRQREIPLSPPLLTVLESYRRTFFSDDSTVPYDLIFKSKISNRSLSSRQVQRIFSIASVHSIQRHVTPHMLRHTFATNVLRRSNLRVTQMLLGHTNVKNTQIYTHPNGDDLRKAINVDS